MTLEPTPLPISGTPQVAAAQYDHWTEDTLNHSNPAIWVKDAPAGMTLEPTPPISTAQYDPWTVENHNKSNEVTWTAGAPAGKTVEATPLPITGTPTTANPSQY